MSEGTVRVRMTVAYDGSGFHGFAPQSGQRTVAGALAGAMEAVVGEPVRLTCAGRTDAGVHAWGQVVHADLPAVVGRRRRPLDAAALGRSCTAMLGPEVVVREAVVADPRFDARRCAVSRCYRYWIHQAPFPDPWLARWTWHLTTRLELRAMEAATDPILGEQDFSAFCRRPPAGGSLVRRVKEARWTRQVAPSGDLLCFHIEASSFCHQMVRSLVGLLVEVGRGRRRAGEVSWVLRSGDRSLAASPAPPHGLCLWEVRYPKP